MRRELIPQIFFEGGGCTITTNNIYVDLHVRVLVKGQRHIPLSMCASLIIKMLIFVKNEQI